MNPRLAAGLLAALLAAAGAAAQLRTIPEGAKRGEFRPLEGMTVSVDGEAKPLSPGAQIRDQNNRILVPTMLPPEGAAGAYLIDANGAISRVWLLTPAEQAQLDRRGR